MVFTLDRLRLSVVSFDESYQEIVSDSVYRRIVPVLYEPRKSPAEILLLTRYRDSLVTEILDRAQGVAKAYLKDKEDELHPSDKDLFDFMGSLSGNVVRAIASGGLREQMENLMAREIPRNEADRRQYLRLRYGKIPEEDLAIHKHNLRKNGGDSVDWYATTFSERRLTKQNMGLEFELSIGIEGLDLLPLERVLYLMRSVTRDSDDLTMYVSQWVNFDDVHRTVLEIYDRFYDITNLSRTPDTSDSILSSMAKAIVVEVLKNDEEEEKSPVMSSEEVKRMLN